MQATLRSRMSGPVWTHGTTFLRLVASKLFAEAVPLCAIKLRSNPQERRYRVVGSWFHRFGSRPFTLRTLVGYERANTFAFQLGDNRDNFVSEMHLQLNF